MLVRAQMTALIALAAHDSEQSPILIRDTGPNEPRGLRVITKKMNAASQSDVIPIYSSHEFNERDFGELQGLHSSKQSDVYDKEYLTKLRTDFYEPFPNGGESNMNVSIRVTRFFEKHIRRQLNMNHNVLICSHGFVTKVLIKYLTGMSDEKWEEEMIKESSKDLKIKQSSILHTENAKPIIFSYDANKQIFVRLDNVVDGLLSKL